MPASPPAAVSGIPGVAGPEAHRRPTKVYSVDRESRYSGVGQSKQTESSQATHFRKLLRGGRSCAAPLGVTEDSQAAPGGGAPEASNSSSIHFEDPSALPFKLPAGVYDVDAKWMQDLLHFRGTLPPDINVSSIHKEGVGMTAGYFSSIVRVALTYSDGGACGAPTCLIVKSWPPFEILPKESIKTMFIADMKGCMYYATFYIRALLCCSPFRSLCTTRFL